jgi:hypothetical protein
MRPLPLSSCGIIVGCDVKQEYLLPYFYLNLRLNTDLPIVFFDFGLSVMGKAFCQKRGQVITISKSLWDKKESTYEEDNKHMWFKKPLAFKKAPFKLNLWIDLDCKVIGPLDPIFQKLKQGHWLAIHQEPFMKKAYNSGVIVFKKHSPFISLWIKACKDSGHNFRGDQEVLSDVLTRYQDKISYLDPDYNFLHTMSPFQVPPSTVILHYCGFFKFFLQKELLTLEKTTSSAVFQLHPLDYQA